MEQRTAEQIGDDRVPHVMEEITNHPDDGENHHGGKAQVQV